MLRDKVEALVKELVSATQGASLYGLRHNLTQGAIEKLYARLNDALTGRDEITIGIIGDEVAFEKEPFYKISKHIEGFIAYLKEKKIEKVSFTNGALREELEAFISIITMNAKSIEASGGLEKIGNAKGIRHIVFGRIAGAKFGSAQGKGGYEAANKTFQKGVEFLDKAIRDMDAKLPPDVKAAGLFINDIISNIPKNRDSFLLLTAVKHHDIYTFIHSINVAILTLIQADALGLKADALTDIGMAGLLHDSGKLALSGEILRKTGKLTREDVEKIQVHPIEGAKILIGLERLNPVVAIASFEHHVRYDMTGYPQKLYGRKMNLASMLVAISDMYDALRSRRAYHEESAPEKVYKDMTRLAGYQFQPDLLDNFFRIIGVYPPGTLVELDNKAVGIVINANPRDIRRPKVEILYSSSGKKEENPHIIDLDTQAGDARGEKPAIARSIPPSDNYQIPVKYL